MIKWYSHHTVYATCTLCTTPSASGKSPILSSNGSVTKIVSYMMPPKAKRPKYSDEDGTLVGSSPDGEERFTLFYGQTPIFSNFHPSQFELNEVTFKNTEQYFHYMKASHFEDEFSMKRILDAKTPTEQKRLGRRVKNYDQDIWQEVCKGYMKEGNIAKYKQNPELRKRLFESAGTTLVEASPRDCKWGIGLGIKNPKARDRKNWRGSNLLGCVLMEVREELMKMTEYEDEIKTVNKSDISPDKEATVSAAATTSFD